MRAFHSTWTKPFFIRNQGSPFRVEPFELFTTALSALEWRTHNGPIRMLTDRTGAAYYRENGLAFLWDDGLFTVLDEVDDRIDPSVFWAAGKLFALRAVETPCVMLDTDFIVWQKLDALLADCDCAAIHREDIVDSIYPPLSAFRFDCDLGLESLDWTVRPLNTALAYFGEAALKAHYTDRAIELMCHAPEADDGLTYMVLAEQRLLAMLTVNARVRALSELGDLFLSGQQLFTHIWGHKQQLRSDPAAHEAFCRRCAARLSRDFPAEAARLADCPPLAALF